MEFQYYNADSEGSVDHLIDVQATVDGMSTILERPDYSRAVLSLNSRCAPVEKEYGIDSCGEVYSVPPGTHTVEFTSTIVGHDAPASVQRTFDISCPEASKVSPTDEDPPSKPTDMKPPSETGGAPATQDEVPVDKDGKSKAKASGCSLGSSAELPGAGWLLAAAALWVYPAINSGSAQPELR